MNQGQGQPPRSRSCTLAPSPHLVSNSETEPKVSAAFPAVTGHRPIRKPSMLRDGSTRRGRARQGLSAPGHWAGPGAQRGHRTLRRGSVHLSAGPVLTPGRSLPGAPSIMVASAGLPHAAGARHVLVGRSAGLAPRDRPHVLAGERGQGSLGLIATPISQCVRDREEYTSLTKLTDV